MPDTLSKPLTGAASNPWFVTPRRLERPGLRLFCLAHAGGAPTLFHTWPAGLPEHVEVVGIQLPGHGSRYAEKPLERMDDLVARLLPELIAATNVPFAFFGHSMGALIACEAAGRLERVGRYAEHIFVSACRPPHMPVTPTPMHRLPEHEFIERLRRIGGIPDTLLDLPEFLDAFLPMLRADFTLIETWRGSQTQLLTCPMTAFVGTSDPLVTPWQMREWQRHTGGPFVFQDFAGGHFYLKENQADFLARLAWEIGRNSTGETQ